MKPLILKTLLPALLLAGVMHSVQAQTVTLRFHQFLPPQAPIPTKAIAPWAEKIEKDSGGRIKVQLFPSMQLGGKPPELLRPGEGRGGRYRVDRARLHAGPLPEVRVVRTAIHERLGRSRHRARSSSTSRRTRRRSSRTSS